MARQTREHKHEKRIVRTLIFPTVQYGCETWTMTKKMDKKINACEMWIWRKMQRISWTEKTNKSVRMEIGIERFPNCGRGPLGFREALKMSAGKWGNYCFRVEFREKNV